MRGALALTYSALLFGITAMILLGIYLALSRTIDAQPLDPVTVKKFTRAADGTIVYRSGEQFQAADLASVQRAVNFAALETLRNYSIVALMIMFGLSLIIGWWVAGRALRPVEKITTTAREITATDLSRRIETSGPPDELRTLADTINAMLARLETPSGRACLRRGRISRACATPSPSSRQRRGRARQRARPPSAGRPPPSSAGRRAG